MIAICASVHIPGLSYSRQLCFNMSMMDLPSQDNFLPLGTP
jgi:hypothetical protein